MYESSVSFEGAAYSRGRLILKVVWSRKAKSAKSRDIAPNSIGAFSARALQGLARAYQQCGRAQNSPVRPCDFRATHRRAVVQPTYRCLEKPTENALAL